MAKNALIGLVSLGVAVGLLVLARVAFPPAKSPESTGSSSGGGAAATSPEPAAPQAGLPTLPGTPAPAATAPTWTPPMAPVLPGTPPVQPPVRPTFPPVAPQVVPHAEQPATKFPFARFASELEKFEMSRGAYLPVAQVEKAARAFKGWDPEAIEALKKKQEELVTAQKEASKVRPVSMGELIVTPQGTWPRAIVEASLGMPIAD